MIPNPPRPIDDELDRDRRQQDAEQLLEDERRLPGQPRIRSGRDDEHDESSSAMPRTISGHDARGTPRLDASAEKIVVAGDHRPGSG